LKICGDYIKTRLTLVCVTAKACN